MKRSLLLLLVGITCSAHAEMYGFSDAEIEKVKRGAVLSKDFKETSDKELAGVVAVFIKKPVRDVAGFFLEGKHLKSDSSIHDLQVWKPDATPKLDAKLKERFEAYRKSGLKGAGKPGEEIALAIKALPAERWGEFTKALLKFPGETAGIEHRFFSYRQEVDGQDTFILSHRAGKIGERDASITEQRYYVSRTYDCRFIATDCVEASGGTLVFYINCLFTDQVTGMGSSMKHSIGRKRMLSGVVENLRQIRDQLAH